MAIPLFDKEVRVHQLLGDNPNTENNLSADEIKKKFDTPAEEIKEFINSVIVPALTGLIPDASLIFVIGEERPMFNPVLWLDVSGQDDFTIGALKYIDANGTEFPFYPITKASSIADLQDLKEEMEAQVKLMQSSAIVEAAYAKEAAIHKLTAPAGSKNLKFSPTTPYEDGDVITYNGIIMTPKTQDGEPLSGGAWAAGAVVMCFVSGNMLFFRGGGGGNQSMIIVTAPAGSTVTCSNGTATKPCAMKDGKFVFRGCDIGSWTITSTKAGESPFTETIEITEENQMLRYYVTVIYRMTPEFTYTGDYEVVDDNDNPITDFANWKDNWKIRFLTSGDLMFTNLYGWDGKLDVFLVGGGGDGGNAATARFGGGGAGGGRTETIREIIISTNIIYSIVVGAGCGKTSAFSHEADPGDNGTDGIWEGSKLKVGKGGLGTGRGGNAVDTYDGENGEDGIYEFGESSGKRYGPGGAGGGSRTSAPERYFGPGDGGLDGGGGKNNTPNGTPNTGGGGVGGTADGGKGGKGGSGIVVARNARAA